MQKLLLMFICALSTVGLQAQEIDKPLASFNKIVVSPKINLILTQGDTEHIRLVYANITPDKINIDVDGRTLRLFLDDARIYETTKRSHHASREGIYRDVVITACVTYKAIRALEIRGDQELICNGELNSRQFTLKAYGENEIRLSSVSSTYFKTSLYGANDLKINGGQVKNQQYRLFGENKIDTRALHAINTTATLYGESRIKLTTTDELKVNSFGEGLVYYQGDAIVSKGFIFGRPQIARLN